MKKAKVGITLDVQDKGDFSPRPHNALRVHYFNTVSKAGGLALAIPHIKEDIDLYLQEVDVLIVPGGDFALDPAWYENSDEDKPFQDSSRLDFDVTIIQKALDKDIPILGICAGMQIMGCINGAKMTADLHKYYKTDIKHDRNADSEKICHQVIVENKTLLSSIVGKPEFGVNTSHVEALVRVPDNIIVSGKAEDGVIEAIEIPGNKFALGVQWHPEYFDKQDDPNFQIFRKLIEAA